MDISPNSSFSMIFNQFVNYNIINGNEIKNKEALANPEVLEQYKNIKELDY